MRLHYAIISGLSRWAFRLVVGLRTTGMEHIPRTGKVIFASNHRSNYDPPLLGGTIPREVHFFAKEELFKRPGISQFLKSLNAFPVRRGQLDRKALSTCLKILSDDGALIFFPEGTRAPADGFLKAKLGIGWLICKSKAPVLPVYIHGSTIEKERTAKRPAVDIVFGKAVTAEQLMAGLDESRGAYQAVADRVLESIRELSLSTPDNRVIRKGKIYDRGIIEDGKLR
ncbi:1-acyl-sn-glycerol-3-phosphate acyltransferase [bacterium]|nr:1-acyl-sn-glycerol-3-phosphate acyltransferase [bacterium]